MRWDRNLPLIERLRATWVETTHHEQTVGFLGSDAFTSSSEVAANVDGAEAANLIEKLQADIERMVRYVQHDAGCNANDLDYLDDTPCTCGLRAICNPKGAEPHPAPDLGECREVLEPFAEAARNATISGRPPFEFVDASAYERAAALLAKLREAGK